MDAKIEPNVNATRLIAIETTSAIVSAGLVAPFISIIDKAIFSNASGKEPLVSSLLSGFKTLVTRPFYFVKQPSFLLIWGVYGSTYVVGNNIMGFYEARNQSFQIPKFIGSSIANVGLSVAKDMYFTRNFGVGVPKPVPALSYSLYAVRDSLTIFASFNLPTLIAEKLNGDYKVPLAQAETVAQLITPCAVQLVSTPLHLLGMDLYNRPANEVKPDRLAFIKREYVKTTLARMGRIFPAFGIGGVANKSIRKHLKHSYLQ